MPQRFAILIAFGGAFGGTGGFFAPTSFFARRSPLNVVVPNESLTPAAWRRGVPRVSTTAW